MHILAGLLALIGVIVYFLIRANNAARTGHDIVETVSDIKTLKRKWDWQRDAGTGELPEVTDPRLAATAMMCAIATSEGEITEKQSVHIRSEIASAFKLNTDDAVDLFGQGRWLAGQLNGPDSAVLRWSKVISGSCTEPEQRQLVSLLESTAAVESKPTDEQRYAIQMLKTRLAL